MLMPILVVLASLSASSASIDSAQAAGDQIDDLFVSDAIRVSDATIALVDRQRSEDGAFAPVPSIDQAQLDRALVISDWKGLDQHLMSLHKIHGHDAVLTWLATRHLAGYMAASLRYAKYSLAVGTAENDANLKAKGVMLWFYIHASLYVEESKCVDRGAVSAFWLEIHEGFDLTKQHVATLPWDELHDSQSRAVDLEKEIAPARAADPMICQSANLSAEDVVENHLDHMASGDQEEAKTNVEVTPEGKTVLDIQLPMNAAYHPSIRPADAWQAEADTRRSSVHAMLDTITAKEKN